MQSDRTFRWMKRYVSNRSPVQRRLDGKQISHFDVGKDFLSTVLPFAASKLNLGDEEVAFTVSVEAFEHYENWLTDVAEVSGIRRFRLIDEPSAAAFVAGVDFGYDIGFRKVDNAYEVIADWWGIRDISQEKFVQQVYQRYGHHATKAKLEEQGFSLVSEEVQEGERIHLVLRRTV